MRQSTMYRRAEKDSAVHGSGIHPEDQQPNESINKRQRTAPSIASTSVPLLRQGNNAWNRPGTTSGSRGGSHYSERNRDGWAQQAGSGMPRRGSYDRGGRGRDHFQQFSPQQHSTLDAYQISRFQIMHSRPNHRNAAHELNPIACTESSDQALCHTEESHPTTQASTSSEYQVSTICESVSPDIISLSENHPIARVPRVKTQEYIARVSTPPLKRRRLDQVPQAAVKSEEAEDQEQLTLTPNSRAHPPPSVIKSETRSPSPPSRRLVTESCSLYPIPDNCRKANPNPNPAYLKNRHALIAKESRSLKRLGLKPKNVLFRYDYISKHGPLLLIAHLQCCTAGMMAWLSNGPVLFPCGLIPSFQNRVKYHLRLLPGKYLYRRGIKTPLKAAMMKAKRATVHRLRR